MHTTKPFHLPSSQVHERHKLCVWRVKNCLILWVFSSLKETQTGCVYLPNSASHSADHLITDFFIWAGRSFFTFSAGGDNVELTHMHQRLPVGHFPILNWNSWWACGIYIGSYIEYGDTCSCQLGLTWTTVPATATDLDTVMRRHYQIDVPAIDGLTSVLLLLKSQLFIARWKQHNTGSPRKQSTWNESSAL